MRSAVVGLGDVSAVHLAAIRDVPGAELVGVCSRDPRRA